MFGHLGLIYITLKIPVPSLHDHPLALGCPDVLSLVGQPLSADECGSPNCIVLVISF